MATSTSLQKIALLALVTIVLVAGAAHWSCPAVLSEGRWAWNRCPLSTEDTERSQVCGKMASAVTAVCEVHGEGSTPCKAATEPHQALCQGSDWDFTEGTPTATTIAASASLVQVAEGDNSGSEDPTTTLVKNKMSQYPHLSGCFVAAVAVNGARPPENAWASDLCFDTRLRFSLSDGTNSADWSVIGGDSVCTVSVCQTHVLADTYGVESALPVYPSDSYWNGKLLTRWSVYLDNVRCGEMKKYSLCQLNVDNRGRATQTTVTGSDGKPLPAQCKSSKECAGLISFDLRYVNLGDNWATMGATFGWYGHIGPNHWNNIPMSLYDHMKGLDAVKEGANLVCQAKCAKL